MVGARRLPGVALAAPAGAGADETHRLAVAMALLRVRRLMLQLCGHPVLRRRAGVGEHGAHVGDVGGEQDGVEAQQLAGPQHGGQQEVLRRVGIDGDEGEHGGHGQTR